jgi:nucleoside 2-deoxyribosyltransferase
MNPTQHEWPRNARSIAPLSAELSASQKTQYVYLCGPIAGLTYREVTVYYETVACLLPRWIVPVSPMRFKHFLEFDSHGQIMDKAVLTSVEKGGQQAQLTSPRGIVRRDSFDVHRVDAVLANLLGTQRVSIGSMFEIAWAYRANIPVVLVMEPEGNVHDHPFVTEAAGFRASSLREGVELLKNILSVGL